MLCVKAFDHPNYRLAGLTFHLTLVQKYIFTFQNTTLKSVSIKFVIWLISDSYPSESSKVKKFQNDSNVISMVNPCLKK